MKIKAIRAQEILDSRANPTIATQVILEDGSEGFAAVSSGASKGKYEAVELRDNDPKRYNGLGVLKAVENVNTIIAKTLIGMDAKDQKTIDQVMVDLDGTESKARLGANSILSVSLSVACAQAKSSEKKLYEYLALFNPDFNGKYIMPIPQMNVLNGGKHGNWSTDVQEYLLIPLQASSFSESVRMCSETYHSLKKILQSENLTLGVGDEGGFSPGFASNTAPFEILTKAVGQAGYKAGIDIAFGIDAASSEFYKEGTYNLVKEKKQLDQKQLSDFWISLKNKFPIVSMEDVFFQDDWEGFSEFTLHEGEKTQIVGDDLYVTNVKRVKRGIDEKATNAVLIKPNQIGTLSETIDAVILAKKHSMIPIVSHRSGEAEGSFIADFAVAMNIGQIKAGAPCRGERTAKYNRLMFIERELAENQTLAAFPFLP